MNGASGSFCQLLKGTVMLLTLVLAAAVSHGPSATWCWSPDLKQATCIYAEKQCRELVKLRRVVVCMTTAQWRELRK
jgi:hypothetical protein